MGQTTIEWTDYTFNPVWGCEKVSPGCKLCYADTFDRRLGGKHWGPGSARRLFGDHHWAEPLRWQKKAVKDGRIYRVFCASMADWLEDHPQWVEPRRRLEALVAATPNLIWLFLTKRPENWRLMPESWQRTWPVNAMFGFTAENGEWMDNRFLPWLDFVERTGAPTFFSCEPLLGPLDLGFDPEGAINGIDWVIAGGESGAGARPMHPDWARSLRDQCAAADVPFLFKQWGEWRDRRSEDGDSGQMVRLTDAGQNGQDLASDGGNDVWMQKVGKKAAGRLLDGIEHNGLPAYWPSNVGLIESDPLKIVA